VHVDDLIQVVPRHGENPGARALILGGIIQPVFEERGTYVIAVPATTPER